jgi:hypothetical protein
LGETDVFDLIRAWDEAELCAGIQPALHGAQGQGLLQLGQLGQVAGNGTLGPRLGFPRMGGPVRGLGLGAEGQRGQKEQDQAK